MTLAQRFTRARQTGHFTDHDFDALLEGGWTQGVSRSLGFRLLRAVAQDAVAQAARLFWRIQIDQLAQATRVRAT